jgi:hypothetical protein
LALTDAGVTLDRNQQEITDQPPTVASTPNPIFVEGTASTYDMSADFDDDGQSTVTYTVTNTLPNGVTLNQSTGVISYDGLGSPSVSSHTGIATDAVGSAETPSFSLQIFGAEVHYPIASVSLADNLNDTFDIYILPVDSGGSPTGPEYLIQAWEIADDQGVNQLAFPGCEGFGRLTVGGRGGQVIKVTNTNNSGAGSLRAAVNTSGARAIVFDVSGTIILTSALEITDDNCSIYAQSAPGDGIQITENAVEVFANEVILDYVKARHGSAGPTSSASLGVIGNSAAKTQVVFNHCEAMFAIDECFDLTGQNHTNISVLDSIIAWGLHEAGHPETFHSKGMLVNSAAGVPGPSSFSIHRCMIANCVDRYPLSKSGDQGWYNCLFFNKARNGLSTSSWTVFRPEDNDVNVNIVNCMYDDGPEGSTTTRIKCNSGPNNGSIYSSGNEEYSPSGAASEDIHASWTELGSALSFPGPATTLTATAARTHVIANAGADVPAVDALTQRVRDDANGGTTGTIIDTETEVGGFPTLTGSHPAGYDDDFPGIEDTWALHAGMGGAIDETTIHSSGWSYLELFMNDLAKNSGTPTGELTYLTWPSTGGLTTHYRIYINDEGVAFNASDPYEQVAVGDVT